VIDLEERRFSQRCQEICSERSLEERRFDQLTEEDKAQGLAPLDTTDSAGQAGLAAPLRYYLYATEGGGLIRGPGSVVPLERHHLDVVVFPARRA
jgi:hypothetical protein